jgi:hypothetical protein
MLYADFPSVVRLKWLTGQVVKLAGQSWEPHVEMWKLDSVTPNGPIKEMIAQEAGEADVLIIAMSSLDQREPALTQWLDSVVAWKTNCRVPGLLIGLLGDEEHQAGELDWMVSQLGDFARRTQMGFIWRWMDRDAMDDASWLVGSVEALLTERKRACGLELGVTTPSGEITGESITADS